MTYMGSLRSGSAILQLDSWPLSSTQSCVDQQSSHLHIRPTKLQCGAATKADFGSLFMEHKKIVYRSKCTHLIKVFGGNRL